MNGIHVETHHIPGHGGSLSKARVAQVSFYCSHRVACNIGLPTLSFNELVPVALRAPRHHRSAGTKIMLKPIAKTSVALQFYDIIVQMAEGQFGP